MRRKTMKSRKGKVKNLKWLIFQEGGEARTSTSLSFSLSLSFPLICPFFTPAPQTIYGVSVFTRSPSPWLPKKGISTKSEKCQGGKRRKERKIEV